MRLLEYQAKKLLGDFGLHFSEPQIVHSPEEAAKAAARWSCDTVLKAQIPYGNRGKAGAVRFAADPAQAQHVAAELFALEIHGQKIHCVSVEARVPFLRELYVGITWDLIQRVPVALLTTAGGAQLEAAPEDLHRRNVDPWQGLPAYQGREIAAEAGLQGRSLIQVGSVLEKLSRAFLECDALVAEINPLVETPDGEWVGLDARVEIEDDAAFRQQKRLAPLGEIFSSPTGRSPTPLELEAQRIDALDHRGVAGRVVEFEGDLGLLIGGGGASLTVFDAVRRHGGNPANYCEVGGNPTEEKVAALTALILSKPGVRKLAVIMNVVNNTRADVMARGVLMGLERAGRKPAEALAVFRIPGNWESEARQLLHEFGIEALGRETSLDAAARLAVERTRQNAL